MYSYIKILRLIHVNFAFQVPFFHSNLKKQTSGFTNDSHSKRIQSDQNSVLQINRNNIENIFL